MKTIKVEKASRKEINYTQKDGSPGSFIKYSVVAKNVWYDLKGIGKEDVKEGDTITGLYTESDWSKGGKSGVNRILELVEPEIQIKPEFLHVKEDVPPESSNIIKSDEYALLLARVTALENAVFGAEKGVDKEPAKDDLPF